LSDLRTIPIAPTADGGCTIWIDSASLVGDGLSPETALGVRAIMGSSLSDAGYQRGRYAPVAVHFPSWPPRIYVDGVSIVGDALSPATALRVVVVAGHEHEMDRENGDGEPVAAVASADGYF